MIFVAAILTFGIGAGVLWANARRFINRVFVLFSLAATLWLICVYMAIRAGIRHNIDLTANPVPWLRLASAIGAFFPWVLWLLKESIIAAEGEVRKTLRRSLLWFALCLVLAALCFTPSYILPTSSVGNPQRGGAYLAYGLCSFSLYLILIGQAAWQTRRATGIRRIEMQFLTLNGGLACLSILAITSIGNFLNLRSLARLAPAFVLIFYGFTSWAVTIHRVFNARQIFISLGQRVALMLVLCLGIFGLWQLTGSFLAPPLDLLLSIAIGSVFAFSLDEKSRGWLRLTPERNIAALRREIIEQARTEPNPEKLIEKFQLILRTWGQTDYAALLFDSSDAYASDDLELAKAHSGCLPLCRAGWTTPESLQRQRTTPALADLRQFLERHGLGVLVTAPAGSLTPSLLMALGTKVNAKPFTYPEVQQLQSIAELMDNTMARLRLTLQARQSDQLATIGLLGASLAHEIRNPLVSIKTFAHFLPTHYADAEFRNKFGRLIPEEVDRIASLTQQLLDLSNPRHHNMEPLALNPLVLATIDLMQNRTLETGTRIETRLNAASDTINADRNAIRQVLINLLINALQSLETKEGDRRIEIETRNATAGLILEISDNGAGIPPDLRSRLFRPFASGKIKGIGLGLTICADILREHGATIIVPENCREGALFRITFPCQQHSS